MYYNDLKHDTHVYLQRGCVLYCYARCYYYYYVYIVYYIVYVRERVYYLDVKIYNIQHNSILYRTHRYYMIYTPDARKYCFDIVLNIIVVCHIIPTYIYTRSILLRPPRRYNIIYYIVLLIINWRRTTAAAISYI